MKLKNLITDLQKLSNPIRAEHSMRFFKTGPGEYGAGDKFYGLSTPESQKLVVKYHDLSFTDIDSLLASEYHEQRLIGLLILVRRFTKADSTQKKVIYDFYLAHTSRVNNWDLVDVTTPKIVGEYLLDKDWSVLKKLAKSKSLWERRIAIIATFAFIYKGRTEPTLTISELLLHDTQDLIHKAVGWMLREVGKRCNQDIEEEFLKKHYKIMPRTMLRYAIERFPDPLRLKYLKGYI